MKKLFTLLVSLILLGVGLHAQVTATINVTTAGTLSTLLTADQQTTVTNLAVTGTINSDDLALLKSMATTGVLSVIDLGGANVIGNSIDDQAFAGCSKLTSITLPNSVTSIGRWAFDGCSALASVTIPNSVTSIGMCAFRNCIALTSITLPNTVKSIGSGAFWTCSKLTSITLSNTLTTIGNYAFYGCSALTSVTIPNSVTTIEYDAFQDCSGLTSVTISNSVTSIENNTFSGCSSLTSITLPNSVTSIGSYAFTNCSALTSVTIPNSVTSIGSYAFQGCSALTSITLPNSVTSIGKCAFYNCTELTSVTIPNSVTSIGDYAFSYCSKLTSITLPNAVTSIGSYAFSSCSALTSVTIPNSVTSIGSYAFSSCINLSSIKAYHTNAANITLGANVFSNVSKTVCKIYVPKGSETSYATADQWKDFAINSLPATSLTVSANTASLPCVAGITTSIGVIANIEWDAVVTSSASWLTLISNAKNNADIDTLTFTASANTLATSRTATVTLTTYDKTVTRTITVTQDGVPAGSGTEADPYLIYTYNDLNAVSNHMSATYRLMADIDASSSKTENLSGGVYQGFLPIGMTSNNAYIFFTGSLHGGSHKIKNLYINRATAYDVGLFGTLSSNAAIDSLGMQNVDFTGGVNDMGGISAAAAGCSLTACYVTGSMKASLKEGGLVGCVSSLTTITDCYFTGSLSGGTVAGSIVGLVSGNVTITRSYSTGNITSRSYAGGMIGVIANSVSKIILDGCYATGSITGSAYRGGLVGNVEISGTLEVQINNCYWDVQTMGLSKAIGLGSSTSTNNTQGLTTAAMKKQGSFTGFGFSTTGWGITEGKTYPALNGVNNAPFAFRDTLKDIQSVKIADVLGNDYDYETGQTALVYKILQQYGTGTIDASGIYTFPAGSVYGAIDSLRYRAGEVLAPGDTLWGNEAKAILIKINVVPVAANDAFSTLEDMPYTATLATLLQNDTDADVLHFVSFISAPYFGSLTVSGSNFSYTPSANRNGTEVIEYVVSDGLATDTARVTITVTPVNDAPVITSVAPATATEEVAYTYAVTATDIENDALSFSLTNAPTGMTMSGHVVTWTPTEGILTSGEVTLTVNDGTASTTEKFTIAVTPVNDAPVITSVAPTAANEEVAYSYTVTATDAENDALTFSLTNAPTGMTISGHVVTWTPAEGILTSGEVTLTVNDGTASTTEKFTITVTPVNDAPVITSVAPTAATEEVAYTYTVTATDAENDALSFSLTNAPTGMTISGNVVTWTPTEGILTSGEVTLTVNDGTASTTEQFTITVTPVNDAPVITSVAPTLATEEVAYTYTVTATDAENDALSFSLTNAPTGMTISGHVITWTPAGGVFTSGEVVLTVSDGQWSDTQTFSITVTPQSITLQPLQTPAAACAGSNIELAYTILSGSPTDYRVTYGNEALAAGFTSIDYTSLSVGQSIVLAVPAGVAEGTYTATLQMRNGLAESVAYPFSFTVNLSSSYLVAKFGDVILVDNTSNRFVAYQWYKEGVLLSGATEQYYSDPQGLSGSYYTSVTTTTGEQLQTCSATFTSSVKSAPVSISVYPNPATSGNTISVAVLGFTDEELSHATLTVCNSTGVTLYRTLSVTSLTHFTLNNAQGVCIVHLIAANGKEFTYKVTLTK